MKRMFLLFTLVGLMVGCSPTWFNDFKSDPVKQTDIVLDSAMSIEQIAIVVFGQLKPLLPADKQALYQSKFDGTIIALNSAMEAVRAAVKAAADAQQTNPDLSAVIADVVKAIDQVKAVVDEIRDLLKAPPPAAAPGAAPAAPVLTQDPAGYAELNSFVARLKKPH